MGNNNDKIDNNSDDIINAFVGAVRPLDLIVFRGEGGVSTMIEKMEKKQTGSGAISHVEVAMNRAWCPKTAAETDEMLSWGSTMSGPLNDNVCNIETGKSFFGVQLRSLRELAREYYNNKHANIGYCRLLNNPAAELAPNSPAGAALREGICSAYDKYNGRSYSVNPLHLLTPLLPFARKFAPEHPDGLFCSEFVALVYIELGIINDTTDGVIDGRVPDARNVLPVDFLGHDADEDGLIVPVCEPEPVWLKPVAD